MSQDHPPDNPSDEEESRQDQERDNERQKQDIHNAAWLTLSRDERILWWGHPSLLPHVPVIAASIIAIFMGIALFFIGPGTIDNKLFLALVPFGIISAASDYARVITTFYVVTDDKVVRKVGIIRRDTIEVRYENIEHCRAKQNVYERLLSYGDIELATAGTELAEMYLDNVRSPRRVANLINQKKDDAYNNLKGRGASYN